MISVVIPLYNKRGMVARTLRSVLAQTFRDFEVVIVDDGSTDGSVEEARSVMDERIRIVSQQNAGVSAARNRGIAEARYNLIAFLDADDEWKPTYLETQYNLYKKYPDCAVFACNYEFRSADGKVTPTIIRKLPFVGTDGMLSNYFEVASCSHPPICSISIMVKKEAIQSIGGFPVGIKSGEDLLTWARLATLYKIAYSRCVLAVFIDTKLNSKESKIGKRAGGERYITNELRKLYDEMSNGQQKQFIKDYIIRWYKIYAVTLIEIRKSHSALSVALEAIKFGGPLKMFIPIICLSLFPGKMASFILKTIKHK